MKRKLSDNKIDCIQTSVSTFLRITKAFFVCALAMSCLFLLTAGATAENRFPGEPIEANPESLREEHEAYVLQVIEALGRYATDQAGSGAIRKYTLRDSKAEYCVGRFDGGWFMTNYQKITYENGRTENYSGNGLDEFSCDAYLDCVVKIKGDNTMTYDMAYRFTFKCPDPNAKPEDKWKLTSFTNLPQEPDRMDMDALNSMDEGITVAPVTGPTFKGFLMTVADPSRVYVGVWSSQFSTEKYGFSLDDFYEKYGATAVINGGGFADPNGMGKGGKPNGIVVTEGKWLQNHAGGKTFGTIIGFDENDRLVIRQDIEKSEAKNLALRDAVAFSPALILNGQPVDNTGYRTELSCRTAIGQREDGAVLMLVVDGRQPDSLGSSMAELTQILLENGAVNAANLDGGTSTALYYKGIKVNDGTSPDRVSRNMPTAFIVR